MGYNVGIYGQVLLGDYEVEIVYIVCLLSFLEPEQVTVFSKLALDLVLTHFTSKCHFMSGACCTCLKQSRF